MKQRGDAVRLRVVERPVEQQVGVGAQPLMAALFPGDRVVAGEPDTKAAGGEFIGGDDAVIYDEPRDGRTRCGTVRFERVNAGGVLQVSIAGAVERVAERLSNPSGIDTSLPSFEASSHAARIGRVLPIIQGFFWCAGMCRGVLLGGLPHPGCLRASSVSRARRPVPRCPSRMVRVWGGCVVADRFVVGSSSESLAWRRR